MENQTRTQEYTSSMGITATIKPLPLLLRQSIQDKLNEEWPQPTPPTYEVDALGDIEIHEHDKESAYENPESKRAWDRYQDEFREWDTELAKRTLKMICVLCIDIDIPNDGWEDKLKYLGIDIPDGEIDKKVFYLEKMFFASVIDTNEVMGIAANLALKPTEVMKATTAMFQRMEVEKQNATKPTGDTQGELGDGQPTSGDDVAKGKGSSRVEQETE